jgi:ABC-type phosphate transport system substrate-binding protein
LPCSQIRIGYEGVAALVGADGTAAQCISKLGNSVSLDQLRWMFSSFTMSQLLVRGFDPKAVPFWNDDDSTHLWSELNDNCTKEEIQLAWVDLEQHAYDYLDEQIFTGMEEKIDTQRGDAHGFQQLETIADYLENHGEAIAFIQIGNLASQEILGHAGRVTSVSIGGALPSADAFESHAYPLSKTVYLGIWNNPSILKLMAPFLEFALNDRGTQVLAETEMWAIDEWERVVMKSRLGLTGGVVIDNIVAICGPLHSNITIAGSVAAFPVERIFSEVYKLGCPTVDFHIEQGGK